MLIALKAFGALLFHGTRLTKMVLTTAVKTSLYFRRSTTTPYLLLLRRSYIRSNHPFSLLTLHVVLFRVVFLLRFGFPLNSLIFNESLFQLTYCFGSVQYGLVNRVVLNAPDNELYYRPSINVSLRSDLKHFINICLERLVG